MTAVKVQFEIGHEASIRTKKTPEGFTHDWEVFVRGQEGADISHFVEKVVFYLHETFTKPKRVVNKPPFAVKESGYAGFNLPIEIHVRNKDEPKKIKFNYDLNLPQTGPTTYNFLKDRYIFQNPNEDFKKKLLKGGGIIVSNNAFYTNPDQETRSRDSFTEEKQLVSKPKLSSDSVKKHKTKEHKEEIPHRTSSFENLFGPPIQKPPKVSPDPKKIEKIIAKSDKKDKERSNSDKQKSKHEHKESKPEKVKEKDKIKAEKSSKSHSKESERTKDKSIKRPNERPPSPEIIKKKCLSPNRRPPSPSPRSNSASSIKEEYKPSKMNIENFDKKATKTEERLPENKVDKEGKEKKKKEKKSHDREKERKEKKEHKKEGHKSAKESPKEPPKEVTKPRETPKEKENVKESPVKEKPVKAEKPFNKFSIENLQKTPQDNGERLDEHKTRDRSDPERKHKHKKKDKKKDESREKHKETNKDKKHKYDKIREIVPEKVEIVDRRETPAQKERILQESASPISIDTASQCSSKSGVLKTSQVEADEANSSHSDSEGSVMPEDDIDVKPKVDDPSPESVKEQIPSPEPELEPIVETAPVSHKEKSKKHKDKTSKREEKRRKRKAAEEEDVERKVVKTDTVNADADCGESSGTTETKVQDNGVSSSLGEDAEPGELSPDYMVQLRELQQRIMTIKSNEELERVVNLIAETGRYEVTTQTFDFDLCLLDRSTVQQLIQLVGC